MSVNDVLKLEVCASSGRQWVINTMHFVIESGMETDPYKNAQDLINAWDANVKALWLAMFPASYILEGVRAKKVMPGGGWQAAMVYTGVVGAVSGHNYTSEVGACITFPYTKYPNTRWYSARQFLPGAPTGYIVDGVLIDAYINVINYYATYIVGTLPGATNTYDLCVLVKLPAPDFELLPEYVISGGVGTQRKRAVAVLGKPNRSTHKRKPPSP